MALHPGDKLGPYEVLARLGAGGMGEVYKARDTRLDRTVAIKISKERFSDRFDREARAVAALNHPNICQLYDVGPDYLVLEYVEGAPLAPVDDPRKLLDLAVQIADGMAAAHAAGIVHRDLKPDNILVTRESRVKILDFGLARRAAAEAGPEDATRTMALTQPGAAVGTVSYMSPEQARGEPDLTAQSDQFAFGLVLYEMLSGRRAFQRASPAETMAAIIREDTPPLPPKTPVPLQWVVARLLAKDALDRYDSSRDLFRELRQIRDRFSEASGSAQAALAAPPPRSKRALPPWAMLAAGLAAGAAAVFWLAPRPVSPPDLSSYRFTPVTREAVYVGYPVWSPDGKTIAYVKTVHGRTQLFTRAPWSPDAAQITRAPRTVRNPFWSPDGATIYYYSAGDLWAVGAAGGTPERVFRNAQGASLHPDGKTFFFYRDGKFWTSAPGAEPREFPTPPAAWTLNTIGFSPDGSRIALSSGAELWILPYPAGEAKRLSLGERHALADAAWMPDSRRLVISRLDGLAILDTAGGGQRVIHASTDSVLHPNVSRDGKRIAFVTGRIEWELVEIEIPGGTVRTLVGGGGISYSPDWAPSGTHYLYATNRSGRWTIEDAAASGGFSRRLAEAEQDADLQAHRSSVIFSVPRWAPDGSRFAFTRSTAEKSGILLANASGGPATPLDPAFPGSAGGPPVWSPDGAWIVYERVAAPETSEVVRIRPGSPASAEVLLRTGPGEGDRRRTPFAWSPTGEWILARGGFDLFLVSPDFRNGRKLTSRGFGRGGIGFTRDGRELIGLSKNTSGEGALWQIFSFDVRTGAERKLADVDLPPSADDVNGFSMHPDGKRFGTSIAKFPYDVWMLEGFE